MLVLGLLLGLAAVVEELAGTQPLTWRAAHNALLLAGTWLLATGAVLHLLQLSARQVAALCWSLVVTVYAFATAILIQAITGTRALSPGGTLLNTVAYVANIAHRWRRNLRGCTHARWCLGSAQEPGDATCDDVTCAGWPPEIQ